MSRCWTNKQNAVVQRLTKYARPFQDVLRTACNDAERKYTRNYGHTFTRVEQNQKNRIIAVHPSSILFTNENLRNLYPAHGLRLASDICLVRESQRHQVKLYILDWLMPSRLGKQPHYLAVPSYCFLRQAFTSCNGNKKSKASFDNILKITHLSPQTGQMVQWKATL